MVKCLKPFGPTAILAPAELAQSALESGVFECYRTPAALLRLFPGLCCFQLDQAGKNHQTQTRGKKGRGLVPRQIVITADAGESGNEAGQGAQNS
jgi:hypothetical protein